MRKYETYSSKEVILVCGDIYNLQIALWMSSDLNHSKFCLWSSVAPDMNCQSIAMRFLIKKYIAKQDGLAWRFIMLGFIWMYFFVFAME